MVNHGRPSRVTSDSTVRIPPPLLHPSSGSPCPPSQTPPPQPSTHRSYPQSTLLPFHSVSWDPRRSPHPLHSPPGSRPKGRGPFRSGEGWWMKGDVSGGIRRGPIKRNQGNSRRTLDPVTSPDRPGGGGGTVRTGTRWGTGHV